MKNRNSLYLYVISFISTIGGFLFGYDTAIISGCNSFLQTQFQLTAAMLGWVVSSALLGTIVGCVVSGLVTDRIGRKNSLILAAFLLTVSAIGSMLVPQFTGDIAHGWINSTLGDAYAWLIIFRMIGGIGVGQFGAGI